MRRKAGGLIRKPGSEESKSSDALLQTRSLVRQNGKRLNCRPRLEELSILHVAQKLKQCYEEVTAAQVLTSPEPVPA